MDAKFGKQPASRSWCSRRYIAVVTALNAAIAIVTVSAISFHFRRPAPTTRRPTAVVRHSTSQPVRSRSLDGGQSSDDALVDQASAIRVESFASVAPAEYYEILLRTSPEEIAAIALQFNELQPNSRTAAAVGMFFQAWAELDGKTALEGSFRIKDLALRRRAINCVLQSMSASVAPEAAMFLKEHPDPELSTEAQANFFDAVFSRWAEVDPAAAAIFFQELGPANDVMAVNARRNIARAWGSLDPAAALTWIDNQPGAPYSESLFDSVISGWSRSDPAAAMSYVTQHLDTAGAVDAASSVALELLNRDPQAAANWLRQLPPGEARSNAEHALASAWTERDPVSAASWAQQTDLTDEVGALFTVARVWAVQDWQGTRQWLDTLAGPARDIAIAGAVTYADVPTSESLPLAVSINNSETRLHTVRDIVETWASRDRDAAATWVLGSGLSPEEKQEILRSDIFLERNQP